MPDEATQFMTARVTDDTTGPNVDVAWQNLEAAIRNAFGFPADTDLTPAMDITAAGAVTLPVSLTLASGSTVDEILNDDDFAGAADDQLATAISIKNYVDAAVAGGGTGISHGDLSDRDSDSDGHSIYALLAGTRGTQTFAAGLEINGTLTTGNHVIMNGSTKVLQVAGPVSFNNTSGPPQASADPSVGTDLVRKSYADVHYGGGGGGGSYLPLDGSGEMTGDLDMGGNKIEDMAEPQLDDDGATKGYVDDNFLALDGSNSMANHLEMGNHRIQDVADPEAMTDAATRNWVAANYEPISGGGSGPFLPLDGSEVMTGALDMDSHLINNVTTPVDDYDAATKKYVDDNISTPSLAHDIATYVGTLGAGAYLVEGLTAPSDGYYLIGCSARVTCSADAYAIIYPTSNGDSQVNSPSSGYSTNASGYPIGVSASTVQYIASGHPIGYYLAISSSVNMNVLAEAWYILLGAS
jgi:hypothetical protein